jgi:hypothetical protein
MLHATRKQLLCLQLPAAIVDRDGTKSSVAAAATAAAVSCDVAGKGSM